MPGSRIIMTAPPTPDAQRDSRGGQDGDSNADDSANPPPAAPPAAAAGEGGGGSGDRFPARSEAAPGGSGVDGVAVPQPYRPKLHHTTFEEPTETLARLVGMAVVTGADGCWCDIVTRPWPIGVFRGKS